MTAGFPIRNTFLSLLAAITWFALFLQFRLILGNGPVTGFTKSMLAANFFSYFTILSNLLVAVFAITCLLTPLSVTGKFFSKPGVQSAISVYIFIVGLVYNLILRKLWSPTGWQLVADNLLHTAVPLLYILYWYFFTPRLQLQWKQLFSWLIFPACYLGYTLIRGEIAGWYPYPFLDAGKLGYGHVAINSMGVLVIILLTGSAAIAVNRKGIKQEKS